MKNYQVIGGQYEFYWYGESDTLHGAKKIAKQHEEYWDNHYGWHRPCVYKAGDVQEIESHGYITHRDGEMIRVPKRWAEPVA